MANPAPNSSTSSQRPRVIRLGILLGGKIIEEKIIHEHVPITVGQSMKNMFSVPIDGMPMEFTLFGVNNDKYDLHVLPGMDGRISDGGQIKTLEELRRAGQKQGDAVVVPLSYAARGKVALGELTVLFQFVTEPPKQPKPMLPASVRGSFADRIEPQLAVIMASSILVHFGIVLWALLTDPPQDVGIVNSAHRQTFTPDSFAVDVVPPQPAPKADGGAAGDKGEDKPKAKPAAAPKKPAGGDSKPAGGGRAPDNTAAMQEEVSRFVNELATDSGDGPLGGGMSGRRPDSDLGKEVAGVRDSGSNVAIGGGSGRGSRGNGDPRTGTGRGTGVAGPGGPESVAGGKGDEKGPGGRISVADRQAMDDSTLTADVVLQKIQSAYMNGLKRCYKNYLAKDASARGKVTLSFTVNETGRAVSGRAKGVAGEVEDCISAQMGSWRFPVPKDDDGEATDAAFSISLQLVPE